MINDSEDFSQRISVMRNLCIQTSQEHSLRTAIFSLTLRLEMIFIK